MKPKVDPNGIRKENITPFIGDSKEIVIVGRDYYSAEKYATRMKLTNWFFLSWHYQLNQYTNPKILILAKSSKTRRDYVKILRHIVDRKLDHKVFTHL